MTIERMEKILDFFRACGKEPISAYLPCDTYQFLYQEVAAVGIKAGHGVPTEVPVNFWFGDVVIFCGKSAFLLEFL